MVVAGKHRRRRRKAEFRPVAVAVSQRVRVDVAQQRQRDSNHTGYQGDLVARMGAVIGAQEALARREEGAPYALRQSLVDLAAVAELLADDLPPPTV